MRGISTERHTLCPSEVREFGEKHQTMWTILWTRVWTTGGITVENMCKRWIKQAFPKENSLLTKPEAASGKGKKHNVQRMGFSFKPLKHERNA